MCNNLTTNEWEVKHSEIITDTPVQVTIRHCHHFNQNKSQNQFTATLHFLVTTNAPMKKRRYILHKPNTWSVKNIPSISLNSAEPSLKHKGLIRIS